MDFLLENLLGREVGRTSFSKLRPWKIRLSFLTRLGFREFIKCVCRRDKYNKFSSVVGIFPKASCGCELLLDNLHIYCNIHSKYCICWVKLHRRKLRCSKYPVIPQYDTFYYRDQGPHSFHIYLQK